MTGKIILDLCGGTGSWSKPYRDAGYDVRIVTLPDHDVRTYSPPADVYGVLAAPPCTHFSLARTTKLTPRDLRGGMDVVQGCLRVIWECRYQGGLKFWALENPTGLLRQFLGRPPLKFHPCDYGDPYTKATDIWGYYNPPRKSRVALTEDQLARCAINNRVLPDLPSWYVCPPGERPRAARRAMTPQGFAQAFFKANR